MRNAKNININIKNIHGQTALHCISKYGGHLDIVRDLIEAIKVTRADINEKNNNGQTALHYAIHFNHIDIARDLIEAIKVTMANINEKDNQGLTALHLAISSNHLDIARDLIEAIKITEQNINEQDNNGRAALHYAIRYFSILPASPEQLDIIGLLLGAGADVKIKDKSGKDALAYANRPDIANYLQSAALKVETAETWERAGGSLATMDRQQEKEIKKEVKTEVVDEEDEHAQEGSQCKKAKRA